MSPLLSLVVPVLADTAVARALLARIPPDPRIEVILADGGGNPELSTLADGRHDVGIVPAPRGRAVQMNAAASAARGEWLLFLHADCTVAEGWLDIFERAVSGVDGGWFAFALDDPSWQARMIERGVRWRVRLFRLPYGDQGIFVRRSVFHALGGYREMPLMEDVEFVRRLTRAVKVVQLPVALTTSARRWRQDGWWRRSLRNVGLLTLYFAGVPPSRLARWYARAPAS